MAEMNSSRTTAAEVKPFDPSMAVFWLEGLSEEKDKILAVAQAGLAWIRQQNEGARDVTAMQLFGLIEDLAEDGVIFNQLRAELQAAQKGGAV